MKIRDSRRLVLHEPRTAAEHRSRGGSAVSWGTAEPLRHARQPRDPQDATRAAASFGSGCVNLLFVDARRLRFMHPGLSRAALPTSLCPAGLAQSYRTSPGRVTERIWRSVISTARAPHARRSIYAPELAAAEPSAPSLFPRAPTHHRLPANRSASRCVRTASATQSMKAQVLRGSKDLIARARQAGHTRIVCEINAHPPNPAFRSLPSQAGLHRRGIGDAVGRNDRGASGIAAGRLSPAVGGISRTSPLPSAGHPAEQHRLRLPVDQRAPAPFEWAIGEGAEPQRAEDEV